MRLGRIIRQFGSLIMVAVMALAVRGAAAGDHFDPIGPGRGAADQPDLYSASDFGGIGLLQTRTARFGPDGMIWATAGYANPYRRYTVDWQALPWAELGFRYTDIGGGNVAGAGGTDDGRSFNDQAFDLKFKLLDETRYWPAIAIGLQDATGSGHFSSEYLVASKRYFDFDFSLGLAWGYLGNRGGIGNPIRHLFGGRGNRDRKADEGGSFHFGDYFAGDEIGLFGGVEWRTPVEGLSLKLELDGNDYRDEPRGRKLDQDLPINIGLNYRPVAWVDAAVGLERGNRLMVRVALRANLHRIRAATTGDDAAQALRPRPPKVAARAVPPAKAAGAAANGADIAHLFDALDQAGFALEQLDFTHLEAVLHLSPVGRDPGPAAVFKAAKAVFDVVPTPLRQVTVVGVYPGGSRRLARFSRDDIRRGGIANGLLNRLSRRASAARSATLQGRMATPDIVADGAPSDRHGGMRLPVPRPVPRLLADRKMRLPIPRPAPRLLADREMRLPIRRPAPRLIAEAAGASPPPHSPPPRRRPATAVAGSSADPAATGSTPVARHPRIAERVFAALAEGGFVGDGFELDDLTAVAYVTPKRYRQVAKNVGRAARIVANNVPASVEQITIVIVERGMELGRVSLLRADLERAVADRGSPEEIWADAVIERGQSRLSRPMAIINPRRYPEFDWIVEPRLRQHVGGSDSFYNYQLWAALGGGVSPLPGLRFAGTLGIDVINDFDRLAAPSTGALPRVRSDVAEYVRQGDVTIAELYADYTLSPRPDWFVKGAAGIFEQMYGGVSAEVLYRPFDKRWAVGLELNWLGRRDFDQLLSFRDYDVVTGHVSLYYDFPVYDLAAEVHAGRYLARDVGATFQLARHFENGVVIGGFMTFTDVPFDEFGEGSFDKGFFVTVPLDLAFNKPMRRRTTVEFRPLTRDGGQRATIPGRLFELTRQGSLGAITRDWNKMLQ